MPFCNVHSHAIIELFSPFYAIVLSQQILSLITDHLIYLFLTYLLFVELFHIPNVFKQLHHLMRWTMSEFHLDFVDHAMFSSVLISFVTESEHPLFCRLFCYISCHLFKDKVSIGVANTIQLLTAERYLFLCRVNACIHLR